MIKTSEMNKTTKMGKVRMMKNNKPQKTKSRNQKVKIASQLLNLNKNPNAKTNEAQMYFDIEYIVI